ncbi:MAG: alpha/beta hydrolase [Candidatus Atabeyarchaeum deiterrae]
MPFILVNGLKTFYEEKGKGKALILIHGAGGFGGYWVRQFSGLSKNRRVIAIDLPGHGKSERLKEKVSIEGYVDHVAAFMKQMKLDKAVIVGHSMGGLVVQQLALKHPELCDKIIIAESGARFSVPSEYPKFVLSEGFDPRDLLYMAFSEKTILNNPALLQELVSLQGANFDFRVIADDFSAIGKLDLSKKIKQIAVPTLIIVGLDDRMTPQDMAKYLHEQIKGSKLVTIPDAGHMAMMEKPDEFNDAILKFIDQWFA